MTTFKKFNSLYKILILGEAGVGKTSLILRFCEDNFIVDYKATFGVDYKIKIIEIDGEIIKLALWDTAGQERYRSIAKSYLTNSNGIVLCFDISNKNSFNQLSLYWMNLVYDYCFPGNNNREFNKNIISKNESSNVGATSPKNKINDINFKDSKVKVVLVGTKLDRKNDRVVSYEEAKKLADDLGIKYYETSSMKNLNIEELFVSLARDMNAIKEIELDKSVDSVKLRSFGENPLKSKKCFC